MSKPSIHQQASMYSENYANQLTAQMKDAVLGKYAKVSSDEFSYPSWDSFWQLYNRLDNSERHREKLFHVLLNFNPKWCEGKE